MCDTIIFIKPSQTKSTVDAMSKGIKVQNLSWEKEVSVYQNF